MPSQSKQAHGKHSGFAFADRLSDVRRARAFGINPPLSVGLAGIYAAEGDDSDPFVSHAHTRRTTAIATVIYEFAKDSAMTLEGEVHLEPD